jgi:hypothetical protein
MKKRFYIVIVVFASAIPFIINGVAKVKPVIKYTDRFCNLLANKEEQHLFAEYANCYGTKSVYFERKIQEIYKEFGGVVTFQMQSFKSKMKNRYLIVYNFDFDSAGHCLMLINVSKDKASCKLEDIDLVQIKETKDIKSRKDWAIRTNYDSL